MCEYCILLISLAKSKNFGLSWIIVSHDKVKSVLFSHQNGKQSKTKKLKQTNTQCLVQKIAHLITLI